MESNTKQLTMVEFKIGDEITWNKNVKLTDKDWKNCGKLDNYKNYLENIIKNYGKLIIKGIGSDYYQLNDTFYYPKKLFQLKNKNFDIW